MPALEKIPISLGLTFDALVSGERRSVEDIYTLDDGQPLNAPR